MLIPELEDEHRDDDPRVAHAPIKFNQQLPTLKELNAASCHSDLSTYEGIDLSALTRCLLPLSQLEESESAATEIWTFESLLRVRDYITLHNDNFVIFLFYLFYFV